MDTVMVDVWQREVSKLSNRKFTHHLTASQIDLRIEAAIELLRCQPIGGCSVRNPVIPLIWDWGTILFHFLHPLHVVKQMEKKKGGELVDAKKEHVLEADCIEPHPHTTVMASSGADGIKIWTPNAIDKGKLATTKIEQDPIESLALSIAFGVHILMPSAPLLARIVVRG
ncbi:hypothetical protein V6N13_063852 [Hibiscus sabdariffa]